MDHAEGAEKNDAVGSWIRMDSRLEGTEEFMAILCALDLDRMGQDGVDILLGTLKRFWTWFDERTEAGFMRFATERSIDAKIGRPGFAAAMMRVEWLVVTEQGAQLPEFEKRHGKSEKKRMESARRAKRSRRLAKEEQELRAAGILDDKPPRTPSAREAHAKRTRSAHTTTTTNTYSSSSGEESEEEAGDSLEDDYRPAFDAIVDAEVSYPMACLRGAQKQGHTPTSIIGICSVYVSHAWEIGDPGHLMTRLTKVPARAAPHDNWRKKLTIPKAPPPPNLVVKEAEFYSEARRRKIPESEIPRLWQSHLAKQGGTAA